MLDCHFCEKFVNKYYCIGSKYTELEKNESILRRVNNLFACKTTF